MSKLSKLTTATSVLGVCATIANAAVVSETGNALLVPHVIYLDSAQTTAVGLSACAAGTVYWTFHDVDGNNVADGQFDLESDDLHGFIWAEEAEPALADQSGYIVFVLDTSASGDPGEGALDTSDVACLAGNAFYVDMTNNDVAFVPALPLQADDDFAAADASGAHVPALNSMGPNTVTALTAGADAADDMQLRYFIDQQTGGIGTQMFIWSASDVSGTYSVPVFDDDGNSVDTSLTLTNERLNIIDPEDLSGLPADYLDGFIKWTLPSSRNGETVRGIISWSEAFSPDFGARQTLMGTIDRKASTR